MYVVRTYVCQSVCVRMTIYKVQKTDEPCECRCCDLLIQWLVTPTHGCYQTRKRGTKYFVECAGVFTVLVSFMIFYEQCYLGFRAKYWIVYDWNLWILKILALCVYKSLSNILHSFNIFHVVREKNDFFLDFFSHNFVQFFWNVSGFKPKCGTLSFWHLCLVNSII